PRGAAPTPGRSPQGTPSSGPGAIFPVVSAGPRGSAHPLDLAPVPDLQLGSADPPEPPEDDAPAVIARSAEPWVISMFVHLVGLVLAGILIFPAVLRNSIQLEAVFADSLGEQLE